MKTFGEFLKEEVDLKGNKGIVVDMILNINRQSTDIILPKKIINNLGDWRNIINQDCDFYVDFEILSDIIDISHPVNNENSSQSSFIFIYLQQTRRI